MNINNEIINQKLNQTQDIILYIDTNIKYKPFLLNGTLLTQNGGSLVKVLNRGKLFEQGIHTYNISCFYQYYNKHGFRSISLVKLQINDILAQDYNNIKIGECNTIQSKYKFYTVLQNNKYNSICLGSNTPISNIVSIDLTKVEETNKVYPNILGIPNQIGIINITIPLMIGIIFGLIFIAFYFFRKKYA